MTLQADLFENRNLADASKSEISISYHQPSLEISDSSLQVKE